MKIPVTTTRNLKKEKPDLENIERAISLILESGYFVEDFSKQLVERHLRELAAQPNIRKILELPLRGAEALSFNGLKETAICTAIGLAGWAAWTAADRIRDEGGLNDDLYIFSILRPIIDELIGKLSLLEYHLRCLVGIMGKMEYANSSHCSMGVREQSSWKSMGATIPLLALMMKACAPSNGTLEKDMDSCESYFYYLILARQLSDDALDWKEDTSDIGNGRKLKTGGPNGGKGKIIDHNNDTLVVNWLEKAFEERVKYEVAKEMLKRSRQAIEKARSISCFTNTGFLEELARYYEEMAERILKGKKLLKANPEKYHVE